MLGDDHEDQVEEPDDIPAEEDAQDRRNDFSFHEPRDEPADKCRNGDDCKDHADEVA